METRAAAKSAHDQRVAEAQLSGPQLHASLQELRDRVRRSELPLDEARRQLARIRRSIPRRSGTFAS